MKDFSKGLKTARKNSVEDSPLLAQHDEFMETEVINAPENNTGGVGESTPAATVKPQVEEKKPEAVKPERTKGVVVDIPWPLYCELRDMKDEQGNTTLKKLALKAIEEFVKKEQRKRGK